ncbi:methionine/alanine import family NSS transporter small subunit [Streptomyces sp. 3MP-14]|uniref:Methionine/alanine import family NSS transporter small subunit n=1 Tax=Streptomyces mimosae TaxID=2586635 RepID=A0A5N6ANY1_9ACTN|nr:MULTISPECIES: methionine/alanine import family NSS transporter small subunit [Streptomyces]KAB8169803.1 methionine/alanine import family NSS transporter small subunit [Streptomyces mimosae]KAB8178551.1 methionine/alanine import family NSS transporter small subunit [Streptomyces sp. 3MP-14]
MSTSAIVMMIVAMLVVWGGLALAVLNLRGNPDQPEPGPDDVPHQL